MATVNLVFRKSKKNKQGESPIYIRITKGDSSSFISTGVYILPKYWNEKRNEIRSSCPNSERLINYVEHQLIEAKDTVLKKSVESKYTVPKSLKHSVKGVTGFDFFQYADKFIERYNEKGSVGTYRRFKAVVSKMRQFTGEGSFMMDNITVHFLKQYEEYMQSTFKNKNNTIHANLKAIMRIINEAVRDEILPIEKNPFLKYKTKWQQTEKTFLTELELCALESLKLEKDTMKYHHRNIYVFACYAGGMRISDIVTLRWENINGDNIILKTKKTGSTVSVKLTSQARKIIDLYQKDDADPSDFIFPLLKSGYDYSDPETLHNAISSITSYTNTDLKDLAKMAKIFKHVHFHTSRHTWATRALRNGMRIEYVSKLMGHNSIRTTQVYAKIVNSDLDNAMDEFEKICKINSAASKRELKKKEKEEKEKAKRAEK